MSRALVYYGDPKIANALVGGIARRTEPDRLGVHLAAQDARNRARLAEIERRYQRYDARRDPWYTTMWIALWLGWMVAREVVRNAPR